MDKDNAKSVLSCIKEIRERWDSLPSSDDREDYIKSLVKEKDNGEGRCQ